MSFFTNNFIDIRQWWGRDKVWKSQGLKCSSRRTFFLPFEPKLIQDISMQSVQSPHGGSHMDSDTSPFYTQTVHVMSSNKLVGFRFIYKSSIISISCVCGETPLNPALRTLLNRALSPMTKFGWFLHHFPKCFRITQDGIGFSHPRCLCSGSFSPLPSNKLKNAL